MGYTAACAGERTTAKDPSAYFTFNETSIFSGCLFVNISIIYQVCLFFVSGSVSFQSYFFVVGMVFSSLCSSSSFISMATHKVHFFGHFFIHFLIFSFRLDPKVLSSTQLEQQLGHCLVMDLFCGFPIL